MSDKCVICQDGFKRPLGDQTSPRSVPSSPASMIRKVGGEKIHQMGCGHWFHPGCARDWLDQKSNCPMCQKPVEKEPVQYRRLRLLTLVATGFVGFAVTSHLTAAVVRLPQHAVWLRDRLYFGLPSQFGAAWLSLFGGFALGAEGAVRVGIAWNKEKEVEWRHDWKLIVGSWTALWGGVLAGQALLGLIVARTNDIPIRNLWVLSERAHLPQVVRHRMEMAVTAGNTLGVGLGAVGYSYGWQLLDVESADTERGRKRTYGTVVTAMIGLLVASHLFTIAMKEFACLPRRQVWHGFGIAKLFKDRPSLHSRKLALATCLMTAPVVFLPTYYLWVGKDPEE
jgi:Ring finger domain